MSTGIDILYLKHQLGFTPRTILDIGAQQGDFYRECKMNWEDSKVFMIEATKENEQALKKTGGRYSINVLSDKKKIVKFYKNKKTPSSTGNSIYRELTPEFEDDKVVVEEVETTTLNDLFDDNSVFDLIKIDTQGSELDILRGGSNVLKNNTAIIIEVSYVNYNSGAPKSEEVFEYMDNIGYKKDILVGETVSPFWKDGDQVIQQDFVYLNRRFI